MRYFDRTFFKFLLGFICIILFALLAPKFIEASHCTVSQIAIIEGSWENTSTKTSYTLQAQDSSGASCHLAQTLRFSLESTGAGSFTTQSGGSLSMFISSNTANRNFYYDGHPASYTITAKAGYGSADSWTVSFTDTHTIGSSSTSTTSESSTTTSSQTSPSSNESSGSSVHYNATSLSNKKPEQASSVSAGRNRLGAVGSPLEFRAETDYAYTNSTIFKWNFGDGYQDVGPVVSHTYEYPGEYTAVLNAVLPEGQAVSRVNVKIIEPKIRVTVASSERIEIKNDSDNETSLFGRALSVGNKFFAFPVDSIVKAKGQVSFSSKVTGLEPHSANDVSLIVVGGTEQAKLGDKVKEEKIKQIALIQSRISVLEQELAALPKREAPKPDGHPVSTWTPSVQEQTANTLEAAQDMGTRAGWFEKFRRFLLGRR